MALQRLIVGWSRGGLGYITQLLTRAGLEVGNTFDHTTSTDNLNDRVARAKPFEVSPFVVPFLSNPAFHSVPVTFVLRDPMRVFNSLYFHGLFHSEKFSEVRHSAELHLPHIRSLQGRPAQTIIAYLDTWLRLASHHRPGIPTLRVESGPMLLLKSLTGYVPELLPYCPPDVNASYCRQTTLPDQLPNVARERMSALLLELGYREDYWRPWGGHAHYVTPEWHC
jgi:hypothetical protein